MMAKQNTSTVLIQEWLSQYGDDLLRWALSKTSSKESAEDLVQETFLAAFKAIDKFEGKSEPKTWLFSIMNNKIIDHHRKNFKDSAKLDVLRNERSGAAIMETFFEQNGRWKQETGPANWHEIEAHLLDNVDFNSVMDSCLKKLPENWFTAIQLKYLKEENGNAICQELGITTSNYWQILHRAKIQLRACIEQNWFKT